MHIEIGENGKNEILDLVEGSFGEGKVAAHFKIIQNIHRVCSFCILFLFFFFVCLCDFIERPVILAIDIFQFQFGGVGSG